MPVYFFSRNHNDRLLCDKYTPVAPFTKTVYVSMDK